MLSIKKKKKLTSKESRAKMKPKVDLKMENNIKQWVVFAS